MQPSSILHTIEITETAWITKAKYRLSSAILFKSMHSITIIYDQPDHMYIYDGLLHHGQLQQFKKPYDRNDQVTLLTYVL